MDGKHLRLYAGGLIRYDPLKRRVWIVNQRLHHGLTGAMLAAEPGDTETLVETVTLYHMVIEGVLALTGQHFIIAYNEDQGTLPGFVEGFGKVARDEHRHVAFGARFLTDMAAADDRNRDAIQRTLVESLPVAEGVLRPPFAPEDDDDFELFGVSKGETQAFAARCLTRRLKVIGLA